MNVSLLPSTLLTAVLTVPLAAQGSALVVKTTDIDAAEGIMRMFDSTDDLPEAGEGSHWVMSLDDGGRISAKVEQGALGLLRLEARPAQLMELFADEIADARAQISGFASIGLASTGMQPRDVQTIIKAAFEFPSQIDRINLSVDGDPAIPEDGFKAVVEMTPTADSWLQRMVGALMPAGSGAPVLNDSGAMISARSSLEIAGAKKVFEPIMHFAARAFGKTKEEDAAFTAMFDKMVDVLGFSSAMAWYAEGRGMLQLLEVRDPEAFAELQASKGYTDWLKRAQQLNGVAARDVEYTENALEHRGVKLSKIVAAMPETPAGANPMADEDGNMVQYSGLAGSWLVTGSAAPLSEVKTLVERIVDGKIKRAPLSGGRLAELKINIAEFVDIMSNGMAPTDQMPALMAVGIAKRRGSLVIGIDLKW